MRLDGHRLIPTSGHASGAAWPSANSDGVNRCLRRPHSRLRSSPSPPCSRSVRSVAAVRSPTAVPEDPSILDHCCRPRRRLRLGSPTERHRLHPVPSDPRAEVGPPDEALKAMSWSRPGEHRQQQLGPRPVCLRVRPDRLRRPHHRRSRTPTSRTPTGELRTIPAPRSRAGRPPSRSRAAERTPSSSGDATPVSGWADTRLYKST